MNLYNIRGGTKEELEKKQWNIGIGVSLGNRWFSPKNIIESIEWALPYTRDFVIVYLADTIHAINLETRNKISKDRALRIAIRYGRELLDKVRIGVMATFHGTDQTRILYATWADVETELYKKKVSYLYDAYKSNDAFRSFIQSIVRDWLSKDNRIFTENEVLAFGTYLLEELPELMIRAPIKGLVFDAYTYPFDGPLTQFVERLQRGEVFPEIRNAILDTEPKVFLEVR